MGNKKVELKCIGAEFGNVNRTIIGEHMCVPVCRFESRRMHCGILTVQYKLTLRVFIYNDFVIKTACVSVSIYYTCQYGYINAQLDQ